LLALGLKEKAAIFDRGLQSETCWNPGDRYFFDSTSSFAAAADRVNQ
jgi:hypothetical protein